MFLLRVSAAGLDGGTERLAVINWKTGFPVDPFVTGAREMSHQMTVVDLALSHRVSDRLAVAVVGHDSAGSEWRVFR